MFLAAGAAFAAAAGADARRVRLRDRLPRRALLPRGTADADRAGYSGDGAELPGLNYLAGPLLGMRRSY